jgi:hypothetical protein
VKDSETFRLDKSMMSKSTMIEFKDLKQNFWTFFVQIDDTFFYIVRVLRIKPCIELESVSLYGKKCLRFEFVLKIPASPLVQTSH